MSTYVMSDIHGRYDRYKDILSKIKFNSNDKLYIIGDVIDRGDGGVEILRHIRNNDNIELLLGNHEAMMVKAVNSSDYNLWFYNGGYETYKSIGSGVELKRIVQYLSSLDVEKDIVIRNEVYKLVHGSPCVGDIKYPDWVKGLSVVERKLWVDMTSEQVSKGYTVVFGHRCTKYYNKDSSYKIYKGRGMIGVDCGCAYRGGVLGCIRLEDKMEWYSSV